MKTTQKKNYGNRTPRFGILLKSRDTLPVQRILNKLKKLLGGSMKHVIGFRASKICLWIQGDIDGSATQEVLAISSSVSSFTRTCS